MQFTESVTIKISNEEYKLLSEYATINSLSIEKIIEDIVTNFINQNKNR